MKKKDLAIEKANSDQKFELRKELVKAQAIKNSGNVDDMDALVSRIKQLQRALGVAPAENVVPVEKVAVPIGKKKILYCPVCESVSEKVFGDWEIVSTMYHLSWISKNEVKIGNCLHAQELKTACGLTRYVNEVDSSD